MKLQILTDEAPTPQGKYSQAIRAGDWVFLSGQIPFDIKKNSIELNDPVNMYRICFKNLDAVCRAAGGSLNQIVKLNVFYTDIYYSPFLDKVIPEFFEQPYPARIRLTVKEISKGAKVEVDAIMNLGK